MIGDNNTGKTSVTNYFVNNKFNPTYNSTIGVEFDARTVEIFDHETHQKRNIKLHIWDTAGQEQFRSMTKSYYVDAAAAILVFDVTNRNSFSNLNYWLNEIKSNSKIANSKIFLVGNKTDLDHKIRVTSEEAEEYVQIHKLGCYIPTSARKGSNVHAIFNRLSQRIYNTYPESYFNQNYGAVIPGIKNLDPNYHKPRRLRWWHRMCGT